MNFREEFDGKSSGDENSLLFPKKTEATVASPIGNATHLPLNDINNTPTREQLKSLEIAQKRWIEESKSWPVKDEIQNAQLKFIKELSGFYGSALCSSTPQPKKKEPPKVWTLPFSPPKSSADECPRRGVCLYKPGLPTSSCSKNEKRNSIKIARIEEPAKVQVTPLKKVFESPEKKSPPANRKSLNLEERKIFSSFPDSSKEVKKSPKKRFITVRKKLERLKNITPEPEKVNEKIEDAKPSPTDSKSDEKREATRQFMLRKRAERERELEVQRRKESKAEAEKKARMERLRETQLRLLKNAAKKQSPERKPVPKESHESEEELEALWRHGEQESGEPIQLRATGSRHALSPPSKSSSSVQASTDEPNLGDLSLAESKAESCRSVRGTSVIQDSHIAELLLDQNIPTHLRMGLLSRIEEGSRTGRDSLSEIVTSKEYLAIVDAPSKQPLAGGSGSVRNPMPGGAANELSRESLISLLDADKPFCYPVTSPRSVGESYESINILKKLKEKPILKDSGVPLVNVSSHIWGAERSYNISQAVTNKHAAYDLRSKSANNEIDWFPSRGFYKPEEPPKNKSAEKGIQCQVDAFTNEFMASVSLDSARSEQLKKPDVVLVPNRTSDPGQYANIQTLRNEISVDPIQDDDDPPVEHMARKKSPSVKKLFTDLVDSGIYSPSKPRENVAGASKKSSYPAPIDEKLLPQPSDVESAKLHSDLLEGSSSNLSIPASFQLNTSFSRAQNVDQINTAPLSYQPSQNRNIYRSGSASPNRDRRIEEEIRKLDTFNESITSVIEKKKTENELRANDRTNFLLERSFTSTSVNNDDNMSVRRSKSTSSFDLASEENSRSSVVKFSLNMFIELLKNEDSRSSHQLSIFKMKENALTDKIKAEIAFLEVEKKKLKEAGNEEGLRNIRKKIRGLIMKLENDLEDLQKMRRHERHEYKKRRQKLVEKINMIQSQLKLSTDSSKDVAAQEKFKFSTPSFELKKTSGADRKGSECRALILEKKKKELEHREALITAKLAELDNSSQWKHRYEEGEKRILELEARLKMASSVQSGSADKDTSVLVERGTSPFRLGSDESHCEGRIKVDGSYSDTFDQASSSSAHDRLEEKDARKMMAIKVPLSPLVSMKRRHSSGSDDSVLQSQTDTQSEASDMEVRVLALQEQLKQRKAKLESLHREFKKSQKERLIAKEQSLLSQIQAYDLYIDQIQKDLEKEKESTNIKFVKPLIKQPKIVCDRRKSDTWLIQERKNKIDSPKESLQDSPLSPTVNVPSKVRREKQKALPLMPKETLLDSSSLDKLSLRPRLSSSDPALVRGSNEGAFHSRVSQSSTESCESDSEKGKGLKEPANERTDHSHVAEVKEALPSPIDLGQIVLENIAGCKASGQEKMINLEDLVKFNELPQTLEDSDQKIKEIEDKSQSESGSGPISTVEDIDRSLVILSSSNSSLIKTEVKLSNSNAGSDIEEPVEFKIKNNVETTSLGKDNIVPVEVINDFSEEKSVSGTIPEKNSQSEAIHIESSHENSPLEIPTSEPFDLVQDKEESEIEISDKTLSEIIADIASPTSVTNEKNSPTEVPSEKLISPEVDESKVSKSEIISEEISQSIKSYIYGSASQLAAGLEAPVSESNYTDSKKESSSKDSELPEEIVEEPSNEYNASTHENNASNLIEFSIAETSKSLLTEEVDENEEEKLQESVNELDYLEVSDHVFSKSQEIEEEKGGTASEVSNSQGAQTKSSSEETDEILSKETLGGKQSFSESQEASTFHEGSGADDVLSKDLSEDFSNGSFPLPITNDITKIIPLAKEEESEREVSEKLTEVLAQESVSEVKTDELSQVQERSFVASEEEISQSTKSSQEIVESRTHSEKSDHSTSNIEDENISSKTLEEIDSEKSQQTNSLAEELGESKSFSESEVLHESDIKSPLEELNLEDSLEEHSPPISDLKLKSKLYGGAEGDYESVSEASDSLTEEKLSEEDVFDILSGQDSVPKTTGAPLIDALQREGESALDVVWRGIAESEIHDAKELVLSAYLNRIGSPSALIGSENQKVGDNDGEDWIKEKLEVDQAAVEAEVLRQQQLRIDKEIKELQEEEARQLYYVRPIPDKPPPPYTPRRSSLVSSVVEAATEIWRGKPEPPESFMEGSHLREFIWDLASELVLRVNPPSLEPHPPWCKFRRPRPRKPVRCLDDLVKEVEKEAKIYLGVEERQARDNLIIRWSRKRRDHVDEILVRESGEEEADWTDFTEEESILKNRISEALVGELLTSATAAVASAFSRKFKGEGESSS